MPKLTLLKHGSHIHDAYEPLPGETDGAAGSSTDAARPEKKGTGILQRFSKHEPATERPQALGWIKHRYTEAIEYTNMVEGLRGAGFLIGLFGGSGSVFGAAYPWYIGLGSGDWFGLLMLLVFTPIMFLFGSWVLAFGLRFDLFKPADLPIIFDRKHRKVYRILREEQIGPLGFFKPWPLMACEYEWDLVDAEHQAEIVTSGKLVTRNHFLMFAVRKSAEDPTIIDSFQIANANSLGEQLVPAMWEHIRRFMEERGPHLPSPGEPLAAIAESPSWWQCMGATGPFGPNYFTEWRENTGFQIIMHVGLPFFLPMFLIWGTGNWLGHKTSYRIDWPDEVLAAIGPAQDDARTYRAQPSGTDEE